MLFIAKYQQKLLVLTVLTNLSDVKRNYGTFLFREFSMQLELAEL